jgi:ribonucleotide monophosphatase NagD (HAD superfamily)
MVAAVETAAGRKPLVLGKPSPFMFDIVRRRHPAVQPARTLMIGDRSGGTHSHDRRQVRRHAPS